MPDSGWLLIIVAVALLLALLAALVQWHLEGSSSDDDPYEDKS